MSFADRLAWGNASLAVSQSLALPVAALGTFVTAFYAGYELSNIASGIGADWLGPRAMLAGSLICLGVATALFGSIPVRRHGADAAGHHGADRRRRLRLGREADHDLVRTAGARPGHGAVHDRDLARRRADQPDRPRAASAAWLARRLPHPGRSHAGARNPGRHRRSQRARPTHGPRHAGRRDLAAQPATSGCWAWLVSEHYGAPGASRSGQAP